MNGSADVHPFASQLFVAGLIFPALSFLTGVLSFIEQRRGRHASPIWIPVIGPLLMDTALLLRGDSLWLLPLPWLADIGTLAFLPVAPGLFREWWQTSRFTRTLRLTGESGIEGVILTLHRGGRYALRKSWRRAPDELGVTETGEFGRLESQGADLLLVSHTGGRRLLSPTDAGGYRVKERDAFGDLSIAGWVLNKR